MAVNLKGRSLAHTADLSVEEIYQVFETTEDLKRRQKIGEPHFILPGRQLAMIFQKPSTRTRVSFEVGIAQLGGHALYLGPNDLQLKRGETIEDTAKVLGRYVDGIMARVFDHNDIIALVKNAGVPVINGLSDKHHPCQVLTDFFTVLEKKKRLEGLTMAFVGDGDNNMTNSLVILAAQLGVNFNIASPKKYWMKKEVIDEAQKLAKKSGSKL